MRAQEEFKYLLPNQEAEFAEEIAGDDAFRLKVKINQDQEETLDPASYIDHEWIETSPDRYKLKVRNTTGSPVYVAMEDAEI